MPQNDLTRVTVALAPASAPTATLDTSLILHSLTDAQDKLFGTNRYKLLTAATWSADLASLGIADGEAAYEDVQAHFGQAYVPDRAYLARRGKAIQQVWTVVVPSVPADGAYAILVNGTPYSFTAASSSQAAVRTALIAAAAPGSAVFTAATGVGAGDIKLTAVASGTPLTVVVTSPGASMTASVTTGTKVAAVAQVWTMQIITAALGLYVLTVQTSTGQKVYSYPALSGSTVTTIRNGIKALYDADPSDLFGATMTSVSTDSGTLTASLAGRPGSITLTSPASDATIAVTTANYGVSDDITAVIGAPADWYMLILGSHVAAELLLATERIEATQGTNALKMLLVQTSDANNLTDAAGNVLGALQAKSYLRSGGVYHPIDAEGVHAAWAGYVLPNPAGSISWVAKPLVGLTGNSFTDATSSSNLRSNEGSFLELFAARNQSVMNGGYSFRGRPLDITRAIDTYKFNADAGLMDLLVNNLIVPYTTEGQKQAEGVLLKKYNDAVDQGYAVPNTFVISYPDVSEAAGSDRTRGIFPPFTASFTIQAGTHRIDANFTVGQ